MKINKTIAWVTFSLSILVFLISLTQTAYYAGSDANSLYIFLCGLIGTVVELSSIAAWIQDIFTGTATYFNQDIGATFTWLANPIYISSLILLFKSPKKALYFSLLGAAIMFSFSLFSKILINENGKYAFIESLGMGYWLWLTSQLTITLGSITALLFSKKLK